MARFFLGRVWDLRLAGPARPEKELVHDLHFDKGALLIMFFEVVRGWISAEVRPHIAI